VEAEAGAMRSEMVSGRRGALGSRGGEIYRHHIGTYFAGQAVMRDAGGVRWRAASARLK
jgi:hypothetical protein